MNYKESTELQKRLFNIEKLATLGMVARGVCHDMNNKLAAITTSVQTLLHYQKELDPELRESLQLIHEATKLCSDLVQKFFKYSARALNADSEEVINFPEIVDCVVSLLKYRLDQWGIKVETALNARAPFRGHPDEFIHLFMHLFLNAIDSVRRKNSGKGKIQIRTRENETELIAEIQDDGQEVNEEIVANIFKPFVMSSDSRACLDLSIVQRIVRKYRGEVKVKSAAGGGLEFAILLPKMIDKES